MYPLPSHRKLEMSSLHTSRGLGRALPASWRQLQAADSSQTVCSSWQVCAGAGEGHTRAAGLGHEQPGVPHGCLVLHTHPGLAAASRWVLLRACGQLGMAGCDLALAHSSQQGRQQLCLQL